MGLKEDVAAAVNAVQLVEEDVNSSAPSLGDQVLDAITPVLKAAGWTAPAPVDNPVA